MSGYIIKGYVNAQGGPKAVIKKLGGGGQPGQPGSGDKWETF